MLDSVVKRILATNDQELISSIRWDKLSKSSDISLDLVDKTPELQCPDMAKRSDLTFEFIKKHNISNPHNLYKIPISLDELLQIQPTAIGDLSFIAEFKSLTPEEITTHWNLFSGLNKGHQFYIFSNSTDPYRAFEIALKYESISSDTVKSIDTWVDLHINDFECGYGINGRYLSVDALWKLKSVLMKGNFLAITNLDKNPEVTMNDWDCLYNDKPEYVWNGERFLSSPNVRLFDLCTHNVFSTYSILNNPNMTIEYSLLMIEMNCDYIRRCILSITGLELFPFYECLFVTRQIMMNQYYTYPDYIRYVQCFTGLYP